MSREPADDGSLPVEDEVEEEDAVAEDNDGDDGEAVANR